MCALAKSSVVLDRELDQEKSPDSSGPRIRCPLCGWSPRKDDRWSCSCGHEWNTFDTGGVCPACLHHGPPHSAFLATAGRRIPIGMEADKLRPSLLALCSGRGGATGR